jgi:hypothetical protein
MNQELEYLIAEAQKYKMTEEERSAQVRSFAYGNTHFENEGITKAHIDEAVESLRAEREHPVALRS